MGGPGLAADPHRKGAQCQALEGTLGRVWQKFLYEIQLDLQYYSVKLRKVEGSRY